MSRRRVKETARACQLASPLLPLTRESSSWADSQRRGRSPLRPRWRGGLVASAARVSTCSECASTGDTTAAGGGEEGREEEEKEEVDEEEVEEEGMFCKRAGGGGWKGGDWEWEEGRDERVR